MSHSPVRRRRRIVSRPTSGPALSWRMYPGLLAAQLLLSAIVCVAPWLFGEGVAQVWFLAGIALAAACAFAQILVTPAAAGPAPWALVPLSCGLLLGASQLMPAGNAAGLLAPKTVELQEQLAAGAEPSSQAVGSVSLYPMSTRHDLALLAVAITAFALGAVCFAHPREQMWLCGLLAVNGAAFTLFALIQHYRGMGCCIGCTSRKERPCSAPTSTGTTRPAF